MVRELFGTEPDVWQVDALEAFPASPRLALKACKGPGKTAVLAWLGWNFLLTRPHPMCGCTSITGANLKANLWTELARWLGKSPLLQTTFEMTKTEIFAKDHPKTWKMEARTWPSDGDAQQIGNALAGIHAKYVLWLLDESGDYPDAIMPTAEGIFAGEPIEAHIVQAGNPTRLSGPLYRACTVARRLWKVIEITADPDDPKRSPRISIEHAKEQIEQYGIDSPFVLVNIFGRFPPHDINALIGPDDVTAAMKRYYREHEIGKAPLVFGVDVARYGNDASVIFPRRGIQAFPFRKLRNVTSTEGAGIVARMWTDQGADAVFVDDTGGFGSGWIDQLMLLGRSPISVGFSRDAHNKSRYFNKRAEMYFDLVEWIKRGGALPESPELAAQLTQTNYSIRGDRLILEPKADIKVKLGYSPDEADALATSFAEPVSVAATPLGKPRHSYEYDPYASLDKAVRGSYNDGGYGGRG